MGKQVGISAQVLIARAVKQKTREVLAWSRAVGASQGMGECGFTMQAGIRVVVWFWGWYTWEAGPWNARQLSRVRLVFSVFGVYRAVCCASQFAPLRSLARSTGAGGG